ncbi:MAG TPA: hypothetical protein VOB72_19445 [Candidatus Dormibacteraeota bacterium]|nr:hypothetical protein [Candidatus Dormibacteraeota bacterium]
MWALIFLMDRERRRPRRSVLALLLVAVLWVVSHLMMSGPWMQEVGLGTNARPATAARAPSHDPIDALRNTIVGALPHHLAGP